MRILFVTRHFGCLRNFERPIFELVRRGHTVHVAALSDDILGGQSMVERWASAEPAITFERLDSPPIDDVKADLRERVHLMVDYLRYLDPVYQEADGLISRARRRTPRWLVAWLERGLARRWPARPLLAAVLRGLEHAAPRRAQVAQYLKARRADIVLFTPLIGLGSEEQDYLTAAVDMGLRTVFCVWSWDNLSSKSIVRTVPDLVTVWNDTQRDEAVRLHGISADRVVVTGAHPFDQWFEQRPARTREVFCARVGLPPGRPFVLWVCSALFKGSPVEAAFVRRWIEAIRASDDPVLRDVPVLVRPHPSRRKEWASVSLDDLGPVSWWGANPVDAESKADYFDSMYYCAAVAGLNTSAFLEAAVVGRPVYTVLLPEHYDNQEGTLHFPYLLNVGGGLLHAQRSLAAHLGDLSRALHDPVASAERSHRFVASFVRPHGLDVSATGRFVDAIERQAVMPIRVRSRRDRALVPVFRYVLAQLEARGTHGRLKEWLMSPTEYAAACRRRDRIAADRARTEASIRERLALKDAHRERKREQKRAALGPKARRSWGGSRWAAAATRWLRAWPR